MFGERPRGLSAPFVLIPLGLPFLLQGKDLQRLLVTPRAPFRTLFLSVSDIVLRIH